MDFRTYSGHLIERPQREGSVLEPVRNFSDWFFDLLGNFVLVGGLRYFAEKSGSMVLWYLRALALFVILLYCVLCRSVVRQSVRIS